ncbi:acyltransferase [Gammaproteobacteria bacterium]|nr:acyltransferase [Gammaproteobacteria bacterium]
MYRPEIDGLRALAVIPVILFHAGFQFFQGGFVGVDIFFVISGYLIANIIINELAQERFSLLTFYERRARRILPALFFVMFFTIPLAWLWLVPYDLNNFGQSLISVTFFISNVLFWWEGGYFDTSAELKPLLHTWSLAIEEQFYLLFPIFLLTFWKFGKSRIIIALSLIFLGSLFLAEWGSKNMPSASFYLLPMRGWELLLGVFTAFYLKYNAVSKDSYINNFLSLSGMAMIIFAITFFNETTPFPSLIALIPTLGVVLIIIYTTKNTFTYKLLSAKPFVGIGLISYSLYLWHQPALVFARHQLNDELSLLLKIILLVSIFPAAFLSWKYVEKPFRNKKLISRRKILIFSVSGFIFFTGMGLAAMKFNEAFTEVNSEILKGAVGQEDFFSRMDRNFLQCEERFILDKSEVFNNQHRCYQSLTGKPKVALFGDSHAEHLFPGLANNLDSNLIYLIRSGDAFKGEKNFDYLIKYIKNNNDINTVIYSAFWAYRYKDLGPELLYRRLNETIRELASTNKKIIIIADIPYYLIDASNCFYIKESIPNVCSIAKIKFKPQITYLDILNKIAEERNIEIVDPSELFCNKAQCRMIIDGEIMYRDKNHLNFNGSNFIGKYIVENSSLKKM